MNRLKYIKPFLVSTGIIILLLVAVSLLDIIIAVMYARFYSDIAFAVTFGVGGVFAAVFSYMSGIEHSPEKNEFARWSMIVFNIAMGALFYFFISIVEGGEYEVPFKAYGIMLALASLIFVKGRVSI